MTVKIIKKTPIESINDFLSEYYFHEISYEEFRMLTKDRRPLRRYKGFKLYGYRSDSKLTGTVTTYFFMIICHAFKSTLAAGSTDILFEELKTLLEANDFLEELKPCTCGEMPKHAWDCRLGPTSNFFKCYKCGQRSASLIRLKDAVTAWNEDLTGDFLPFETIEDARRDWKRWMSRKNRS